MTISRLYRFAAALTAAFVSSSIGASSFAQAAPGDAVQIETTAAPVPKPALKYRLFPARRDLSPGNAVTLYNRAFSFLVAGGPTLINQFNDEATTDEAGRERFRIIEWLEMPLADLPRDEARSFLTQFASLFREAELAARRDDCEWEIGARQDGPFLLVPDAQLFRSLGQILVLRARLQIADGGYDEALGTLQTTMAFARHLAQSPSESHVLVGVGIAHGSLDRVEELIQRSNSPNLYWAITTVPVPFCDLRPSLAEQREMFTQMFPRLQDLEKGPANQEVIDSIDGDVLSWANDLEADGAIEHLLILAVRDKLYGKSKDRLVRNGVPQTLVDNMPPHQVVIVDALRHYRTMHDEMTKWLHLPYHQARSHVDTAYPKFQSASGVADAVITGGQISKLDLEYAFPTVWKAAMRLDQRLAALRCVEAIRDHMAVQKSGLPISLDLREIHLTSLDPITGLPFRYRADGKRATIRASDKSSSLTYVLTLPAKSRAP